MNSSIKIFLVLLLLPLWGSSQLDYLNKEYPSKKDSDSGIQIHQTSTGFLLTGYTVDSSLKDNLSILVLDSNAEKVQKKNYKRNGFLIRLGRSIKTNDHHFLDYRTLISDTNNQITHTWLVKFNEQGDTLWTKRFSSPLGYVFTSRGLIEMPDSSVTLISSLQKSADYDPLIIRVDKNGNELWRKTINTPKREELFYIVQTLEGDYIATGFGNSHLSEPGKADSWIVRLDSNMNTKWRTKLSSNGYGSAAIPLQLRDSSFVLGSGYFDHRTGSSNYWSRQLLFNISPKGQLIWSRKNGAIELFSSINQCHQNSDSTIICHGHSSDASYAVWQTLTMFNLKGDTIWKHRYVHNSFDDQNYLWDMMPMKDKGFLLAGYVAGGSRQNFWLLKTDSNGCVDLLCKTRVYDKRLKTSIEEIDQNSIRVYPNPAQKHVIVENIPKGYQSLNIINLQGKIIRTYPISREKYSLSGVAPGMYLYTLTGEKKTTLTGKILVH